MPEQKASESEHSEPKMPEPKNSLPEASSEFSPEAPSEFSPEVQAAIDAYRRTLANSAGESQPSASSNDERLLGERPPHWGHD